MVKKQLVASSETSKARAGFSKDGNPANLHLVRSFRSAIGRRLAMRARPRRQLAEAEEKLAELEARGEGDSPEAHDLRAEIESLKRRIQAVPFIDTFDLRYTSHVDKPEPISRAVMFCLMDVSGSMDEVRKDIAAVKAAMPKVLHDIAARALHVHGSIGASSEMPFAGMISRAFQMGLADGPTEVHKVTVAKQLLRDYAPCADLFPAYHRPTAAAAAERKFRAALG